LTPFSDKELKLIEVALGFEGTVDFGTEKNLIALDAILDIC
jgi:hypothetical protein